MLRKRLKFLLTVYKTFHTSKMAKSRYEYVKTFEMDDKILPNVWIVVRVDGKGFHRFTDDHSFEKPNDPNGLNLMSHAAITVMEHCRDITMAYGQSDEYSFIFRKSTNLHNRRSSKLMSQVTSLFSSAYCYNWTKWFPDNPLKYPPCFDARVVLYPTDDNLMDYVKWRQADVHINNLYNTAFWNLVKSGRTNVEAELDLRGTFSADKNEILFTKFGINYNDLPVMYRKGTTLLRKHIAIDDSVTRQLIIPLYTDMIREKFWKEHTELITEGQPQNFELEKDGDLPELFRLQLELISLSSRSCKSRNNKNEL